MKKGVIDIITIIPKEHPNLSIGSIGEMINKQLIELCDEDSEEYEAAKTRWNDKFWGSYFE